MPRLAAAVAATPALALAVALLVHRNPPDFAGLPVVAVVHDDAGRTLWDVRVAPAAHQIAIDSRNPAPPPPGHAYQLWLAGPRGPRSLGLLPPAGRKITAEIPALFPRLAGTGELLVSLEPARGSELQQPSGPIVHRAAFPFAD